MKFTETEVAPDAGTLHLPSSSKAASPVKIRSSLLEIVKEKEQLLKNLDKIIDDINEKVNEISEFISVNSLNH